MDFERILEQWDARRENLRSSRGDSAGRRSLENWIDKYPPPVEKAESDPPQRADRQARRTAARRLPVEAEIDLHGYTSEQAAEALERFIQEARGAGVRKILVIHGKGKHSSEKAVLREFVRFFLQKHAAIGEIGMPKRESGGSGATWAMVRSYRSR